LSIPIEETGMSPDRPHGTGMDGMDGMDGKWEENEGTNNSYGKHGWERAGKTGGTWRWVCQKKGGKKAGFPVQPMVPIHPKTRMGLTFIPQKVGGLRLLCWMGLPLFVSLSCARGSTCVDENVRWTMWTSRGWLSWVRV
jgi:hypothetical protein